MGRSLQLLSSIIRSNPGPWTRLLESWAPRAQHSYCGTGVAKPHCTTIPSQTKVWTHLGTLWLAHCACLPPQTVLFLGHPGNLQWASLSSILGLRCVSPLLLIVWFSPDSLANKSAEFTSWMIKILCCNWMLSPCLYPFHSHSPPCFPFHLLLVLCHSWMLAFIQSEHSFTAHLMPFMNTSFQLIRMLISLCLPTHFLLLLSLFAAFSWTGYYFQ